MHFVPNQLATGQKLRLLTVAETFSRFLLAVMPGFRFRAPDVVEVLERVCYPKSILVDQGGELISPKLDLWTCTRGATLDFSCPGTPTNNAFIESFNGKFRADCPNQHWLTSLDDAMRKCKAWRRDYTRRDRIRHRQQATVIREH